MGIFDTILAQGVRQGQIPARTTAARDWYRTEAGKLTKTLSGKAMINNANKTQVSDTLEYGLMYSFVYDPKMKKT